MTREMVAAAVLVWLVGGLVGWFVGWTARGEQNRAWHRNLQRQLIECRAELDAALAELDTTRTCAEAQRLAQPVAPPVVNVHLTAPWVAPQALGAPIRALDTAVVLPGEGAES